MTSILHEKISHWPIRWIREIEHCRVVRRCALLKDSKHSSLAREACLRLSRTNCGIVSNMHCNHTVELDRATEAPSREAVKKGRNSSRAAARPQGRVGASADGRGARAVPQLAGPRRWGAPWPGVRLTGRAGAEVDEVLVDYRRPGDAGDVLERRGWWDMRAGRPRRFVEAGSPTGGTPRSGPAVVRGRSPAARRLRSAPPFGACLTDGWHTTRSTAS
jgi:hypothetical protein